MRRAAWNGEKADATVVVAVSSIILLEDGNNVSVLPVLRRSLSTPNDGDDFVEPGDDGLTAMFEHLSGDKAHAWGFPVLQALDSEAHFFKGWWRLFIW